MAKFPTHEKNTPRVTRPIVVTPPEYGSNSSGSAAERYLDQQWRDVASSTVDSNHPLSLNRDSLLVTVDPYGPRQILWAEGGGEGSLSAVGSVVLV